MKTTRGRPGLHAIGRATFLCALAAAMVAGPLEAQRPTDPADVSGRPEGRAHLGIMVNVEQERVYDAKGVRVQRVIAGGPADKAGIRAGDVITRVAGKSLLASLPRDAEKQLDPDESAPVQRLLVIARGLKPGTDVRVGYLRGKASHTVTLQTVDMAAPSLTAGPIGDSLLRHRIRALVDSLRALAPELRTNGFPGLRELRHRMGRFSDSLGAIGPDFRWYGFQVPDTGPGIRLWADSTGHGGVVWAPDSKLRALRFHAGVLARDRCPGAQGNGVAMFADDCVGGLALVEINPGLSSYFHTDRGVLVTDVRKDSHLGLQPGDVILRIGARDATSPEQVRRILRSYDPSETVTFHIERKGRTTEVSGHMGES